MYFEKREYDVTTNRYTKSNKNNGTTCNLAPEMVAAYEYLHANRNAPSADDVVKIHALTNLSAVLTPGFSSTCSRAAKGGAAVTLSYLSPGVTHRQLANPFKARWYVWKNWRTYTQKSVLYQDLLWLNHFYIIQLFTSQRKKITPELLNMLTPNFGIRLS